MTPDIVERRLEKVRALYKLMLSLRQVRVEAALQKDQ
jgi:hypothetical protein